MAGHQHRREWKAHPFSNHQSAFCADLNNRADSKLGLSCIAWDDAEDGVDFGWRMGLWMAGDDAEDGV